MLIPLAACVGGAWANRLRSGDLYRQFRRRDVFQLGTELDRQVFRSQPQYTDAPTTRTAASASRMLTERPSALAAGSRQAARQRATGCHSRCIPATPPPHNDITARSPTGLLPFPARARANSSASPPTTTPTANTIFFTANQGGTQTVVTTNAITVGWHTFAINIKPGAAGVGTISYQIDGGSVVPVTTTGLVAAPTNVQLGNTVSNGTAGGTPDTGMPWNGLDNFRRAIRCRQRRLRAVRLQPIPPPGAVIRTARC